jgi:hypothetical protein
MFPAASVVTLGTLRGAWHAALEPLAVVEHAGGLCPMSLVGLPTAGISVG